MPNATQKKAYEVAWRKTLFRDSFIYNYPLHNVGKKITTYLVSAADFIIEPYTNDNYYGILNYSFYQNPTYLDESVTREGLALWITIAGGFLAFTVRFTQFFLRTF